MDNETPTQISADDTHAGHAAHVDSAHAGASISEALSLADAFCLRQGEKLTPIRRKVLELLLASGRATKAYTLLDQMRKIHPGSAPPTVYRALDFLLSLGLVHRVESINAFAACHDLTHCHHGMLLVCQRCGAVSEMHEPEIERVLLDKIKRSGYRLSNDAAELKGVCPDCQTAEALAAGEASADDSPARSTGDSGVHRDQPGHSHSIKGHGGLAKQPA
jgi:Fur family zinc uptake transcriptional regulator